MQLIVRTTEKLISAIEDETERMIRTIEEEVQKLFNSINQECKHMSAMKQQFTDIQQPITSLEYHVSQVEREMGELVTTQQHTTDEVHI